MIYDVADLLINSKLFKDKVAHFGPFFFLQPIELFHVREADLVFGYFEAKVFPFFRIQILDHF